MFFCLMAASLPASGLDLYPSKEKTHAFLIANGVIDEDDAAKVNGILKRNVIARLPTAILLTSVGGALEYTEKKLRHQVTKDLADVILQNSDDLFRLTGKPNLLVINEECSSVCAVLTTMLTHRRDARSLVIMVSPGAKFGLHAGTFGRIIDGAFVPDPNPDLQEMAVQDQLRAFRENGINPDWLTRNEGVFRRRDFADLKADALCKENSLILPPDACLPDDRDVLPLISARLKNLKRP